LPIDQLRTNLVREFLQKAEVLVASFFLFLLSLLVLLLRSTRLW
jgi:hypothetical protein